MGALLCPVLALLLPDALAAGDSERIVVLITSKAPYHAAADEIVKRLSADGRNCELTVVPGGDAHAQREVFERLRKSPPTVIVTGGATMTAEALAAIPDAPIVFFMTPNVLDADFLRQDSAHRDRVAGVPSDVAPAQQVDWIRQTRPNCKRIAVICSTHTRGTAEALKAAARERGIEITPVHAQRDRFPAAIDTLNEGGFDGVVMIPDAQVYNSPTVQRLLLWGLRQKRSVWAFSDKVVKAGALAGIYSDPAQVGNQAAELVQEILHGKDPQSIGLRYPRGPGRAVNMHTAEMIGVEFDRHAVASHVKKFGERK